MELTVSHRKVLLSLILLWSTCISALEVSGVVLSEQVNVDGNELVLNGAGIREEFLIEVYVVGLYLPFKGTSVTVIESPAVQKRILMHFVHSEVSKKKMNSGWWVGFEGNTTAQQMSALKARLKTFQDMFGAMHKGDVAVFDLLPGVGTRVTINDQPKGIIEGDDFSTALLRVWLGPQPVTGKLKNDLLGK